MTRKKNHSLKKIMVVIPAELLREVDLAIASGIFATRSEAIRVALREMFKASRERARH